MERPPQFMVVEPPTSKNNPLPEKKDLTNPS